MHLNHKNTVVVLDKAEYIILEEDNQRISDKYIDFRGRVISKNNSLRKDDIIIREFYYISLGHGNYSIIFNKLRYYTRYQCLLPNTDKIKKNLGTKNSNSNFNFNGMKDKITIIFSEEMYISVKN